MRRPPASTSLRSPGGNSPTGATTSFAIGSEPVQRLGIAPIDRRPTLGREEARQRGAGIVEIPMRVVGGEEDPVPADPFHDVREVLAALRLLHRLGRDPDVVAD